MNPSIFKAYDIRGLCPGEIEEDDAYRIGQAFVRLTKAKVIVVGRDMRKSTPGIFAAFARGVTSQGSDVLDIGLVTTPMLYFAVGDYDLHDAGAMITASHNPAAYNGIKLCRGDASPIGGRTGMAELRDLALAGPYPPAAGGEGTIVESDLLEDYFDRLEEAVAPRHVGRLKVVTDTGNGMEGAIIKKLFKRYPRVALETICLEPDGGFPHHEANPLKTETLALLSKKVRSSRADVGFAFDGDGDRVGVVEETGVPVRGDELLALLAPEILAGAPGAAVFYDVRCSWIVPEAIAQAGGRPMMGPVGHGLIKPIMRKEGAVFGGELSMHYYFKEFNFCESSDAVMLLVLGLLTRTGRKLSELLAPLRRYAHSGEINFTVKDQAEVLSRLEEAYGHEASAAIRIDGLRLEFTDTARPEGDWWFNVRLSNTEPLLRLNLEARSAAKMEEKKVELTGIIEA